MVASGAGDGPRRLRFSNPIAGNQRGHRLIHQFLDDGGDRLFGW